MTETEHRAPQSESAQGGIDWIAAERSPEFKQLVKKRRRFVLPATIFFLGWYTAFVLLAGYAPDLMGTSIYQGFTVGYALALTQFLMVWVLGGLYLRRADRDFDPLARRAAERAIEVGGGATGARKPAHEDDPAAGSGAAPERSSDRGAAADEHAALDSAVHDSGPHDSAPPHHGAPAQQGVPPHEGAPTEEHPKAEAPAAERPLPERPAPEGAGDGGQAPPGLRSSPTPGAAQSRPPRGDDR